MTTPLDDLLAAVRGACLPGLWSQGVKLAREGAVFREAARDDSTVVRVKTPGLAVAPTVTLYPKDGEWTCDCGGKLDPCAHVAAAVIAVAQGTTSAAPVTSTAPAAPDSSRGVSGYARTGGAKGVSAANAVTAAPPPSPVPPPAPRAAARLRYDLGRKDGALRLERWVVAPDGNAEPLRGSLASYRVSKAGALPLHPTHEDQTLDRLVGARQFGYLPPDRVPEVFAALAGASDVRFEGRPARVSAELIVPRGAVVDDTGGGVALVIERDPRVTEVLADGVARCGDTVHRLGEVELAGGRLEKLPIRRVFARADVGRLVTRVLPDLEKRLPIDVKSRRLPLSRRGGRPRILFQLSQRAHTLSVMPELVYGAPGERPEARIENNEIILLGKQVPTRDEAAERDLVARLRDELHLVPGRCVDFDGAEAIRFAERLKGWSTREGGEELGSLFGSTSLVPHVRIDDRAFELTFTIGAAGAGDGEGGDDDDERPGGAKVRRADAAAVLRAYRDGLPLAPLDGGGFAPLPTDWLSRYGDRVADLLAARRDDGTIATAALPALAELCDALERPRPPSLDKLAPLLEGFDRLPAAALPADLTATLRPYQRQGIDWLAFLRAAGLGAVLADDMGLGKTLQALATLRGRTLVVCPRSVVHNWSAEIRRFRPGLSAAVYHGGRRALDPAADITLTTYAILRLDADLLAKEPWETVILDEAQAIKNPGSQVARAAYGLKGAFHMSLSGTPVENRLDELWSQLHFTNRGLLGGHGDFQERYGRPIERGEPGAAARLRRKIRPFVLRRMKAEVAPELPPRTDAVLYCELEDEEQRVYDAILAATRRDVVAKLAEGSSVLAALEALLRLRQAACHPALVPGQRAETSSKVERLVEALTDAAADGHKALVFSQWTSLLDLVEPHLTAAGVSFLRLDGSTRDRGAVVAAFQGEGGPPVMLISLKAGGTGLNLTAADHVFLLDPWWNPAVEDQAADRAHRIGQDRPVMVYRLVAKGTVEEGILALQERKRSLSEAALGEADRAAGLTRDDLLALLA
jgi:superfamily II DNA or RNA helicase